MEVILKIKDALKVKIGDRLFDKYWKMPFEVDYIARQKKSFVFVGRIITDNGSISTINRNREVEFLVAPISERKIRMNAIKDDVINLVHKELKSAKEKFPPFNSAHEGYAVIKEEVEEAHDVLELLGNNLRYLWTEIKFNHSEFEEIGVLKENAINAATELIKVAAMAQKFIDMKKGEKKDE
jgi:hypothetical protein